MSKDTKRVSTKSDKIPQVRFFLKTPKLETKPSLIFAAYRYRNPKNNKGLRLMYSTKHRLLPNFWDKKKQMAKNYYKFYKPLKTDLDAIAEAITDVYKENDQNKDGKLTTEKFKYLLDIKLERIVEVDDFVYEDKTLIGYLKKYISLREKLKDVEPNTIKKYNTLLNKLKDYAEYLSAPVDFEDIDTNWKDEFLYWLYNYTDTKSQNTAQKVFGSLKVIIKHAFDNNIHSNTIGNGSALRIKTFKTTIFALTEKEVNKLWNKNFSKNPRLERVRDWFLVSVFSSLRFSDLSKVKPQNIIEIEGDKYIHMWTKKTNTEVYIPILDERLMLILEKYKFTAPIITNQKFNDYIKEVAEEAKLTDNILLNTNYKGKAKQVVARKCDIISAHDGRRTFCSLGYKKGYPLPLLMQCSGHTLESTFRAYIGLKNKDLAVSFTKEIKAKQAEERKKATDEKSKDAKIVKL